MIELTNITKRYGKVDAVKGVSLAFARGQATAVAGHNGCGKTTLLSIAAGALAPTEGFAGVSESGEPLSKLKNPGSIIGFLPQFDQLFDELTVKDNIKFWASAAKAKPGKLSENVYVCLLGLDPLLKKRAGKLSGGQRRRLSICSRLMADPLVLILDEPFAGLDMYYKRELISVLAKLRDSGKTIIYSAHGVDEVENFADRAIAMKHGVIALDIDKSTFAPEEYGGVSICEAIFSASSNKAAIAGAGAADV